MSSESGTDGHEKRVTHGLVFRTGLEIARERDYWTGDSA